MNDNLQHVIDAYKTAIHFTEDGSEDSGITSETEFSEEANQSIKACCELALGFAESEFPELMEDPDLSEFGYDLWLTRNGHGAGFWDGDWREDFGEAMTNYCKSLGEVNAYESDGLIYLS